MSATEALAPGVERPVPRTPRAAAQRRPQPTSRRRPGIVGGVVWIGALAALLAGIVALNVAVLQLNVRLEELARERANLRAANATLSAQLSQAAAIPQLEALAVNQLGLVPATHEQTTYVELDSR